MRKIIDLLCDNEVKCEVVTPFVEVEAERFAFKTSEPNQLVQFHITLPVTFQNNALGFENGAFRVYLDGDGYHENGKQWNGWLLANGGGWCFWPKLTTGARVSCSYFYEIPEAGDHVLRTMFVGSGKKTSGILRSRRHYQIIGQ